MRTIEEIKGFINTDDLMELINLKEQANTRYRCIVDSAEIYMLKNEITKKEFLKVVNNINRIQQYVKACGSKKAPKQETIDKSNELLTEFMRSGIFSYNYFLNQLSEEDRIRFPKQLTYLTNNCSPNVLNTYKCYIDHHANDVLKKLCELNQNIEEGMDVDLIDYFDLIPYPPLYIRSIIKNIVGNTNLAHINKVMYSYKKEQFFHASSWMPLTENYLHNDSNFYKYNRVVTMEEREGIYNYMEMHDYPMFEELYDCFVDRIVNRGYNILDQKKLVIR